MLTRVATALTASTGLGEAEVGYLYRACHRAFIGTGREGCKKERKRNGGKGADVGPVVVFMNSLFGINGFPDQKNDITLRVSVRARPTATRAKIQGPASLVCAFRRVKVL
jgi:hypothetical protein